MKKQTILKIVISAIVFITILCLEIFGLKFLKDYKILFCSSNQSIDIKDELSQVTGALPNTGTYSVKVVTLKYAALSIYYMSNGQINNYKSESGELLTGSELNSYINNDSIDGTTIYYSIIIITAILMAILITYIFISKKSLRGIIKLGYFILSISVLTFLLCIIPLLSKNYGGDFYYYSIVAGSFLIGLLYGYKNKAFFIPTIIMLPIYLVATWLNYRNGMLWLDNFCGFVFLNFIGALTGRILEKNKGVKKKHIIFYATITILLFIGRFAGKIKPRTATALISDCCEIGLIGIILSLIVCIIYIIIKKIKDIRAKNKETSTSYEMDILEEKNEQKDIDNVKTGKHENNNKESNTRKAMIELIIVIILITFSIIANTYYIKPNNYVDAILQKPSTSTLVEQYSYKIIENTVYVTTDYGSNWIKVPAEFSNIYNTDREFVSDSYYIGNNKLIFENNNGNFISLIYSDDNGVTWQNSIITDTSGYIVYMKFFDKDNGIAMICYTNELGQREFLRASTTHDGGETWTTQKSDNSSVKINRGAEIEFTSINDGTIENISYDGSKTVYVTNDSGKTWKEK